MTWNSHPTGADTACPEILGGSPVMSDLRARIARVAPHAATVLVAGETGTGKELVARALHRLGPRGSRALIAVNCSAIVETLFESELFGHVRGAFTGATEHRVGLVERAHGGTLLLDEVGELSPAMQAKLLRVLETGEVTRVGASDVRRFDVHVIAATNRDLLDEVHAGRFRADFYYRLDVVGLQVPPLRDRGQDVRLLAGWFLEQAARRFKRSFEGIEEPACRLLESWSWPGNVRQLRHTIDRAAMLTDGPWITAEALVAAAGPLDRPGSNAGVAPLAVAAPRTVRRIDDLEREAIVNALSHTRGNKKEAARRLGISRRALYRRLDKFGLEGRAQAA